MKKAKIILGALLVLFAIIIGLIDIGGLVLYLICMGYITGTLYLIDRNKFFKELYWQLRHPRGRLRGNSDAIGHLFSPLMFAAFLYAALTLPNDPGKTNFTRLDFVLAWSALVAFYVVVVFLPAIIRAKRNLR